MTYSQKDSIVTMKIRKRKRRREILLQIQMITISKKFDDDLQRKDMFEQQDDEIMITAVESQNSPFHSMTPSIQKNIFQL